MADLCRFILQPSLLILRVDQFLFRDEELFVEGVGLLLCLKVTHTHFLAGHNRSPQRIFQ